MTQAIEPQLAPRTVPLADGPIAPWADRAWSLVAVAAASVAYTLLARVQPDPRGHGTHEQLGLDACGWPLAYGIPCPACGCTTAACLVVHGRIVEGFATQPFGASVAAGGLLLGAHAALCLLRGRSFVDLALRWPFWSVVGWGVLLLLASWAYTWARWQP